MRRLFYPHGNRRQVRGTRTPGPVQIGRLTHEGEVTLSAEEAKGLTVGRSYTFEHTEHGRTYTHCGVVPEFLPGGGAIIRMTADTFAGHRAEGTPRGMMRNRLARQSNSAGSLQPGRVFPG